MGALQPLGKVSMKILYLGLPLGALALLRDGHTLVSACISRPSMPGMRRLRKHMAACSAPLLGRPDLTNPAVQTLLADTSPDLVVSWFWTRRIPSTVLAFAQHGGVNVHPSLLPRHRGADPYFWTIRRGDAKTGVTAHWISPQYDEGDVIMQRSMDVPADVTSMRLARLLDRPSLEVMLESVRLIGRGEAPAVSQDHELATMAPRPDDDDCEIIWENGADDVLRLVRAAAPEPGAFTGFGDETVVVLNAVRSTRSLRGLDPGDAVLSRDGVLVTCGRGESVLLLEASRESDGKRFRGLEVAALFEGIPSLDGR
jgi:methionyl-tRNA formyltransferase